MGGGSETAHSPQARHRPGKEELKPRTSCRSVRVFPGVQQFENAGGEGDFFKCPVFNRISPPGVQGSRRARPIQRKKTAEVVLEKQASAVLDKDCKPAALNMLREIKSEFQL